MPKYKHVNNQYIELTGSELAEVDARDQAWIDGALDRARAAYHIELMYPTKGDE